MTDDRVERRFTAYKAAYRAGEDADPRRFLAELDSSERAELAVLIDAFLARAPAPAFDAAAFAAFSESPTTQRVVAAVEAELDATARLPELRERARVSRSELVRRLAEELGLGRSRREKVETYYHRLEWGTLDVSGVSGRVFEALGRLLGVPAEQVRAAAARALPAAPAAPMARKALPQADFAAAEAEAVAAAAPAPAPPEWDEVDELFCGREP